MFFHRTLIERSERAAILTNMPSPHEVLSKVQVAKPCPADWQEMRGDDFVRDCAHCSRKVYNLSAMSREEAADLILKTEGRLCVRYFARPDGMVMTKNCGKPLEKFSHVFVSGCAAFLGCVFALVTILNATTRQGDPPAPLKVVVTNIKEWIYGRFPASRPASTLPTGGAVMGDVLLPDPLIDRLAHPGVKVPPTTGTP